MKGRLIMAKTLVLVLVLVAAGAPLRAQTVDEIVAKNAAARGGSPAWRAVRTLRVSGTMDVGKGMQVPFRLELKRPRRMRLEFDFAGSTTVQTWDGARGWKLAPYLGRPEPEPLSEAEAVVAAGQAELDGPLLDYAAKGHRLELLGRETLAGRDTLKLALILAGGARRTVYVDVETGLETQVEAPRTLRGEEKILRTRFSDHRTVAGLVFPHVLESRLEGSPYSHRLTITTVAVNPEIADARFGRPAAEAGTPPARTAFAAGKGGVR
jgi:hypothetical protein